MSSRASNACQLLRRCLAAHRRWRLSRYTSTMATRPAGARTSGHDRRLWILSATAVAVLVLVFVLHSGLSGHKSTEQQIGDAGTGCLTKVSTNGRVVRRWPRVSKAEIIVCQTSGSDEFANYVMDYAQFDSATALSAMLKTAPPSASYCTIGSVVVTRDDLPDTFAAMCTNRGGTLHEGRAGSGTATRRRRFAVTPGDEPAPHREVLAPRQRRRRSVAASPPRERAGVAQEPGRRAAAALVLARIKAARLPLFDASGTVGPAVDQES